MEYPKLPRHLDKRRKVTEEMEQEIIDRKMFQDATKLIARDLNIHPDTVRYIWNRYAYPEKWRAKMDKENQTKKNKYKTDSDFRLHHKENTLSALKERIKNPEMIGKYYSYHQNRKKINYRNKLESYKQKAKESYNRRKPFIDIKLRAEKARNKYYSLSISERQEIRRRKYERFKELNKIKNSQ